MFKKNVIKIPNLDYVIRHTLIFCLFFSFYHIFWDINNTDFGFDFYALTNPAVTSLKILKNILEDIKKDKSIFIDHVINKPCIFSNLKITQIQNLSKKNGLTLGWSIIFYLIQLVLFQHV